jgi:hypothetical protein
MLLTLQTGFFHVKASADERTISMYYDGFTWANNYTFTNPVNGQTETFRAGHDLTRLWFRSLNVPAYCVEPGAAIGYGTLYQSGDYSYWNALGRLKQYGINTALLYGYPNGGYTGDRILGFAITQIIVWEYVLGYRDALSGICTNRALINNLSVPYRYRNAYWDYYNYLDSMLIQVAMVPSFLSMLPRTEPTYTLKYNAVADDYETILYDSNSILSLPETNFSADGISFQALDSRSLKISTRNIISDTAPVNIDCSKSIPMHSGAGAIAVWAASYAQRIITGSQPPDPIRGYMRLDTESIGNLQIVKSSEDNIVAGRIFSISGNGIVKTLSTDSSGKILIPNLPVGMYDITEQSTPIQYNQPFTQGITVLPGRTVTANVTNTLKKGRVKFVKQDSYSGGYLSGAVYQVFKSDGTLVTSLTSDASKWLYTPYLPYGSYYIKEQTPATGFALDNTKYPFSITENEQIIPKTLQDMPLSDVFPTFVTPNATYRSGTEIVASYLIHNKSYAEHASDRPLTVQFTASCIKDGTRVNVTTQQQNVVVPRNDKNLTWFKVKIPSGASKISFTCTIDTPSGVVETNTENNTDNKSFDVSPAPNSQTPNTKFENVPNYFNRPDDNAEVPTGSYATNVTPSATWQQWVYEDGAWSKKTYGMTLAADQQILPDVNSFSSFLTGGLWHMKSGYGLSLTANTSVTQYESTTLPNAGMYVLPQNGNAYFPEFGYELADGKYRTLQFTASNKLEFEQNPYSITAQGEHDGRRIHYTPLWYPDGNYTVKTYLYDCWTPAGMISLQSTLSPIVIGSNIYDDWFINHK